MFHEMQAISRITEAVWLLHLHVIPYYYLQLAVEIDVKTIDIGSLITLRKGNTQNEGLLRQ